MFTEFATTLTGVFTTEVIPKTDIEDSHWNKYVYRIFDSCYADVCNENRCTAMCAFDYPNAAGSKCHFTVFHSNICYLGTLGEEANLLANSVTADLHCGVTIIYDKYL